MNQNLTEIIFILDRSGSMAGLEKDTIGGFNAFIERQKKETGEALVSVVLFDDQCDVIYDRVPISKIEPMSEKQYFVRGCTALLDAMGGAIHHMGNVHKYAREEDVPGKTIVVITTDGMENASRHYSSEEVSKMVKKEQEKYGWEFLFLGANMDAIAAARSVGIEEERAVRYNCDAQGTAMAFAEISESVTCVRNNKRLSRTWKGKLERDYVERGAK